MVDQDKKGYALTDPKIFPVVSPTGALVGSVQVRLSSIDGVANFAFSIKNERGRRTFHDHLFLPSDIENGHAKVAQMVFGGLSQQAHNFIADEPIEGKPFNQATLRWAASHLDALEQPQNFELPGHDSPGHDPASYGIA